MDSSAAPQGPPGQQGGVGQPGSVGEKVRILIVTHNIWEKYLNQHDQALLIIHVLDLHQGEDGEAGVPGQPGDTGVAVSHVIKSLSTPICCSAPHPLSMLA